MAYGKIKADTLVYDNSGTDTDVTIASLGAKANLSSPTFTGTPAAPTAAANTNTTQIATTAYVQTELGDYLTTALGAPKASPALTGTATAVNLTLSGDLTVNGTTTTINSTTLAVDDKNIELGTVDTPTDTTADGGGITLKGATDKEIKWINSTDRWTFNQNLEITTGSLVLGAADTASGHINAYEVMTFNIDADNDDTNRTFKFCTNGFDGAGTTLLTINESGDGTFTGSVTDSKGDLRNIPRNAQTGAYTLVASDAGKVVRNTTGGWTIGANVFTTVGQVVTLLNSSNSDQTITASALTYFYNVADGANIKANTINLGARAMATIWFEGGDTGYIQASALTVS